MASTTPKTILMTDKPEPTFAEALANNQALTPGMLVEETSAGKLQKHSTLGGAARSLFVMENPYDDDPTVAAIDGAYGTADTVRYLIGQPGQQVYAWVTKQTAGSNVSAGNLLESAGSLGALRAVQGTTPAALRVVARALEAVNNSAGTAAARIKVEILN